MTQPLDNTDLDLESVDLSTPLFSGAVKWRISDIQEDTKPGKKKRLVIKLSLEEATQDTTGRTVHPGFTHTDSILLEETGGYTKQHMAEKIARLQCSAFGTDKARNGIPWSDYAGHVVTAAMEVRADRQNPDVQRQEIKRYLVASPKSA